MNSLHVAEDNSSLSTLPMRLTDDKYYNVKFRFGKVAIFEDPQYDRCVLKFDYEIIDPTDKFTKEELNESIAFRNHIGDVLADYLSSAEHFKVGKLEKK